jgi:hypothetical protein
MLGNVDLLPNISGSIVNLKKSICCSRITTTDSHQGIVQSSIILDKSCTGEDYTGMAQLAIAIITATRFSLKLIVRVESISRGSDAVLICDQMIVGRCKPTGAEGRPLDQKASNSSGLAIFGRVTSGVADGIHFVVCSA